MGKHELFSCSTGSQNVISILHTSFHRSLSHSFVRCRCGNIPEATVWLKVLLALLHSFDDACLVSCIHATTRSISILKCSVCSGAYQRHGNRIVIELLHGSPASQNLCPELSALSNLPCSNAQPASVDCHERLLPRQTLRPRGSRSVTGTGCFRCMAALAEANCCAVVGKASWSRTYLPNLWRTASKRRLLAAFVLRLLGSGVAKQQEMSLGHFVLCWGHDFRCARFPIAAVLHSPSRPRMHRH